MGSLKRFNVPELKEKYGLVYFVETGTGFGESLEYAISCRFKSCYSCEIDEALHAKVYEKHKLSRVQVANCDSVAFLKAVINKEEPILFWLDAHYPYSYSGAPYDFEEKEELRCPLRQELELIRTLRDCTKDVILIDDLRVYQDGDYENGPVPEGAPTTEGIEEELYLFSQTHDVRYDYRDEGYIILTPKF